MPCWTKPRTTSHWFPVIRNLCQHSLPLVRNLCHHLLPLVRNPCHHPPSMAPMVGAATLCVTCTHIPRLSVYCIGYQCSPQFSASDIQLLMRSVCRRYNVLHRTTRSRKHRKTDHPYAEAPSRGGIGLHALIYPR